MSWMQITVVSSLALVVGCAPPDPEAATATPGPLAEPAEPQPGTEEAPVELAQTGSSAIAMSPSFGALYAVDQDNDSVTRISTGPDASVTSTWVGAQPARLVAAQGRVVATVQGEGTLAVLRDDGQTLSLEERVDVGDEPFGIVAAPDGSRLYVALGLEDAVVELDAATFEELDRWSVTGQPRWLTINPAGTQLFVAPAYDQELTRIDLDDGSTEPVILPPIQKDNTEIDHLPQMLDLLPRITGDLAISPDGRQLAVPVLYVDRQTPAPKSSLEAEQSVPYGGPSFEPITRFNPSIVTYGVSDSRVTDEGAAWLVRGQVDFLPEETGGTENTRSYLASVTYTPDGASLLATMEGSSMLAVMESEPTSWSPVEQERSTHLFRETRVQSTRVPEGPTAVVAHGDDAWVLSFLDRQVTAAGLYGLVEEDMGWAPGTWDLPPTVLDPTAAEGRRLFYSAAGHGMSADGSGVSCATCHMGGRTDGLTWTFTDGVRQTPNLAGPTALTAPFTWADRVGSIAEEAMLTTTIRMGAAALEPEDVLAVEAFLANSPGVVPPRVDESARARGEAVFEAVGCAVCHTGSEYTNNASYDMFGLEGVDTPTLRGIAATAPYLHDGSAPDLYALIEQSTQGGMSDTSHLTPAEIDDMVVFLRSL